MATHIPVGRAAALTAILVLFSLHIYRLGQPIDLKEGRGKKNRKILGDSRRNTGFKRLRGGAKVMFLACGMFVGKWGLLAYYESEIRFKISDLLRKIKKKSGRRYISTGWDTCLSGGNFYSWSIFTREADML
eukprot:1164646-Amorphochlora_amoeboformis.AAC.1